MPTLSFDRRLRTVAGQASWTITATRVTASLTRLGGHLGPVTFRLGDRDVQPLSVAPWATERCPRQLPPILRVLRGDFFCLPFGENARSYRGEQHSLHGETANRTWQLESITREQSRTVLQASLRTHIRPGTVEKQITLIDGQTAVYIQHRISGMRGRMPLGHHAMLRCPDRDGAALISTSPILFGATRPGPPKPPAHHSSTPQGHSALAVGARFQALDHVPLATGGWADLSRYPARRGYDDLAMVVADPTLPFAWTTVTFPHERYVWFALKDPRILRQTVIWMSNGGRPYAPWNSRHVNVIGLEEATAYFDHGLPAAVRPNPLTAMGTETSIRLRPDRPLDVRYIMAVCAVPRTFTYVRAITPTAGGVTLWDTAGHQITCPLELDFIAPPAPSGGPRTRRHG